MLTPALYLLFILFKGAEDGGGTVLLPDVNEAVFRKLLEFIYTGDVRRSLFWHSGVMIPLTLIRRALARNTVYLARFGGAEQRAVPTGARAQLYGSGAQVRYAPRGTDHSCALCGTTTSPLLLEYRLRALQRPVPDSHQAAGASAVRVDDLGEDLLCLLREPQFSDCTLRVEQQPGLEVRTKHRDSSVVGWNEILIIAAGVVHSMCAPGQDF